MVPYFAGGSDALPAVPGMPQIETSRSVSSTTQEITYGAEFEFTNDWVNENHTNDSLRGNEGVAAKMMASQIRIKCAQLGCEVTEKPGKWTERDRFKTPEYLVTFTNGLWINISYDPLCVEVQTKPMTLQQWKLNEAMIQEVVFKTANELNLEARENRAGHFNIGIVSAFGSNKNVKQFLRFFVDYANHSELASGILRKNWSTAMPLALQGFLSRFFLRVLVIKVYFGQIKTIEDASAFILKHIYRKHPQSERYSITHNQAINLKNARNLDQSDKPLEIRAVRAQKSVAEFIQLIEIFGSRISYTNQQTGPIKVNIPNAEKMSDEEALQRFNKYLTEAGNDPENYKNLVPDKYFPSTAKSCLGLF